VKKEEAVGFSCNYRHLLGDDRCILVRNFLHSLKIEIVRVF